MTVKGIDVASYQSTAFSASGNDFVMVKATEGTNYTNPKHDAQVAHGRAAGLVVGHYHFIRPGSVSAQVNYFLGKAKAKAGDVLILDWEDTGVSGSSKDAFLSYLGSKSPLRSLLYCNKSFWLNRDTTSQCGDGLWIADPDSAAGHPAIKHPWLFHQYAISGGVDRNVGQFATKADLVAWAKNATVPVPPAPHNGGTVSDPTQIVDGPLTGVIGTTDPTTGSGRVEHRWGFFLASLFDQAQRQTALLVEIRDALTQTPQALTGAQVENARTLTAPAADPGTEG